MVRPADFIYGVVPERGEYGFELKPLEVDQTALSRVQSMTSSFQWSATANNDAEAIAVDRTHPPLVVRIVTDPRDPAGRRSVCMHIWIVADTEAVATMIGALWPRNIILPISQDEFLLHTKKESTGRIVVGPNNVFTAVGFDRSWGTRTTTYQQASTSSSTLTVLENTTTSARNQHVSKGSSIMLRVFATLSALALIATAGFAAMQHREVERLQNEVKRLDRKKGETEAASGLLEQQLGEVKKANQQKKIENEETERKLDQSRSNEKRLENELADLKNIVKANPGQSDRAELWNVVRSLLAAIDKHDNTQKQSLGDLKSSASRAKSEIEKLSKKSSGTTLGEKNNE